MATRQTLVVVGVVLVTAFAVVVPAVGAGALTGDGVLGPPNDPATDGLAQTTADGTNGTDAANETQFGTQMAAFMQSNAAQVNDSVEDGMWKAAFERANESERARMMENRAGSLEGRLNALAAQNHSLYERYRNGSLSYEEFVVEASQLNGRMEALEDSVGGTARAAERAGLNVSALDEIRTNARNLTGPAVAGVARGLVDGDTGPAEGVPGRGPPGQDGTDRPGDGPQADRPGGPDGQSGDGTPANESGDRTAGGDGGPPEDPGNQSAGTAGGGSGNPAGGQGSGNSDGTDPPGAGPGNSSGGSGSNGSGPPEAPGASDGDGNADDGANDGNGAAGNGDADDAGPVPDRGRIAGAILLTIWP